MKDEGPLKAGILTPAPGYRTTTASIIGLGAVAVPYYLIEEQGWELQVEALHRALELAKGTCKPVALYIINPGNPAGMKNHSGLLFIDHNVWLMCSYCTCVHTACRPGSKQEINARSDPVCLREEALPLG